jgi:5'-3' exonuclease
MFFYDKSILTKQESMGIRGLNRFIQHRCTGAINRLHLKEFTGKRIAVDTSIYMYRFSGEGALLENMYLMCSVFRHYNINAVFVFDGPPPPQKTDLIELRRKKKDEAKRQYEVLAKIIKEKARTPGPCSTTTEIDDISETMRELKKKFIHLRDCDIADVKELLVSFGFSTIDAEGEADALCANLSLKKRVDACMSDDTDMFVYGCPVVLRNISLLNHSAVAYNMCEILKMLSLSQSEFKMMCVVCGTDYTQMSPMGVGGISHTPESVYKQLMKFKALSMKEQNKYHESGGGFYDWYAEQEYASASAAHRHDHPDDIDGGGGGVGAITYLTNESMFDVSSVGSMQYRQLVVLNRTDIQKKRIIEIMTKDDFIFIDQSPTDEMILKSLSSGNSSLSSLLASPLYGTGSGSGSGSGSEITEQQATTLAKEVYGVDAASFQELHTLQTTTKKRPRAKTGEE